MHISALIIIIGLLLVETKIKAHDPIPTEYLTEFLQLKQMTKMLAENGQHLDIRLFPKVEATSKSESKVSFYFYSSDNEIGTLIETSDVTNLHELCSFNVLNPTVFIIHGWVNNYTSDMVQTVKNAYLSKTENINIFVVDWDTDAARTYPLAVACIPGLGKLIGEFISSLSETFNYSYSLITLVGHSLGAHLAGYVGKNTNGSVSNIVGLDPAGPLFFEAIKQTRLASTDAQNVQAVHTDGKFYGVEFALGDSDFWPNGGHTQPECESTDGMGGCSHAMAYKYFAESLLYNEFLGKQCSDYKTFTSGQCIGDVTGQMGGYIIDTKLAGNYYLKTNLTYPYGIGIDGISV